MLTDANAEYLTANQLIVYDYTLYDGYFTAQPGTEQEEYYLSSFSDTLQADLAAGLTCSAILTTKARTPKPTPCSKKPMRSLPKPRNGTSAATPCNWSC